jgi:ATP-dependent helicase STH1/SNF2
LNDLTFTYNLQAACNSKIQDEENEHPELADLDGSSRNGGSTAPTTSAGTPLASAVPGKLKLTFNSSLYGNGGSSGMQSDEDD